MTSTLAAMAREADPHRTRRSWPAPLAPCDRDSGHNSERRLTNQHDHAPSGICPSCSVVSRTSFSSVSAVTSSATPGTAGALVR